MKRIFSILLAMVVIVMTAGAQDFKSIYDIQVMDIEGQTFDMETLKGKKVLVVNTASECGLTPQYSELEKLYNEYKDKDFVVLAIPTNDFGGMEPGSNEEIKNFVETNYEVSFPVMSKSSVTGEGENPIYQWLTSKDLNGEMDTEVAWNFQKYMIDEDGTIVGVVESKEEPYSDKIINWLNEE